MHIERQGRVYNAAMRDEYKNDENIRVTEEQQALALTSSRES